MAEVAQLRMYQVENGKLREFVEEWRNGVVPLRRAQGFRVEGAWMVEQESRFIWIISYGGPETFESKDRAYYDSRARKSLEPDPARLVVKGEHVLMTAVEVPPAS